MNSQPSSEKQSSASVFPFIITFTIGCFVGCLAGFAVAQFLSLNEPEEDAYLSHTPTSPVVRSENDIQVTLTVAVSSTVLTKPPPVQSPTQPITPTTPHLSLPKAMTATPVSVSGVPITITEGYATELVAEASSKAKPGELTIRNPTIHITEQYIELTGKGENLGIINDGDIRIVGKPIIEDDKVHFRVTLATINKFPLPKTLFPKIEKMIDEMFAQQLLGYDVREVIMREGVITITAVPWQ